VAARSGGWCEAWLGELPCTGRATEMHHRRLRGRRGLLPGTNEASNAAYLCTPCHRWAHHEVAFARDVYGLIVASMADPRRVPIWSRHHRSPVLLLDDGSWQHASAD
jgi:hypothetical protein